MSNPFPQGVLTPPGRNADFQSILLGQGVVENSPSTPYGYAQQWNLGLQEQLAKEFLLDIAYGGAKGTHLPFYQLLIDQLPDSDLSLGSQLLNQVPNPFYGVISSTSSLGLPTVSYGQLLRPFPQYNGVYTAAAGFGNSTYNSLQVKLVKRLSSGASILGAYTHAKLISDTDTQTAWLEPSVGGSFGGLQDSNNLRGEKSLSSQDTPNRLVVAYVYDLPFGRGKRFLANSDAFANAALGGWGLEGTTTLMTGFPLALTTSENLTNSFGGGSRPNVVSGCDKKVSGSAVSRLDGWFNSACFTQPPAFTFGNESRNDSELRAPGVANWDFAAFKSFSIVPEGKAKLQFRAEFFNLFNRVQFGYPATTQGISSFGVVSSQSNNPRLVQFALRLNY